MAEKLMCCLTVAASVLLAQAPAPNASPSGLVRLSVTALDASGEPVTDLKADDFQIADQGKPQHIAFFRANGPASQLAPRARMNIRIGRANYASLDSDPLRSAEREPTRPAGRLAQARPLPAATGVRRFALSLPADSGGNLESDPSDRRQGGRRPDLDETG